MILVLVDLTARFLNYVTPDQGVDQVVEVAPVVPDRPVRTLQQQTRLKEEEILQLIAAYLDGAAIRALARQYRVNEGTVHAHLNRRQVPRRPYRALNPAQVEEARQRYAAGQTINAIATHFGVAHRTVRRVLE